MVNVLETITTEEELDGLRPLPPTVLARIEQKLRLEANYNSNAIEGNTLTLGETRSLILHGLTAHGKPLRDHLDIEGHDNAVKAIEAAVRDDQELNEVFIRNLHRVLLKEPYKTKAETPNGQLVERTISLGEYKTIANNVRTSTGETYFFTPPEQVKQAMSDLIDWYRARERGGEHPIIVAATFHYRFVRIHPFDDGNGRMARLLMNMILIKHGFTVALIRQDDRNEYLNRLEGADKTEDLTEFINYIAQCCEYALKLHLKAARGELTDDIDDIDKEIALFKQSFTSATDHAFSAKEYVEAVLYPFYNHCVDKTRQLSDVFGRVRTHASVFATTAEGKVLRLCEDSANLEPILNQLNAPNQFRSLSVKFTSFLTTFQGNQDVHSLLVVKGEVHAHQSRWVFSIGSPSVRWEHEGRELNVLKRQFNQLLRELMKGLEQTRS